jgi:hypothetical protein
MAQETFNQPHSHEESGGIKEQAREKTSQMMHEAKEKAGEYTEQAREKVSEQLASQKDRVSESLGNISHALRRTGDNMRAEDENGLAKYLDKAAEQVDHFSDYLRNRTIGDLFDEAERFARREPGLFFGGALLLGAAGARFLKSSSPRRYRRHEYEGAGGEYQRRRTYFSEPSRRYAGPREHYRDYPSTYSGREGSWGEVETSRTHSEGEPYGGSRYGREEPSIRSTETTPGSIGGNTGDEGGRRGV